MYKDALKIASGIVLFIVITTWVIRYFFDRDSKSRQREVLTVAKTGNPSIDIEFLAEHEGIKIYRFWDGWKYVYYIDGRGSVQWEERVPSGKTTRIEQHETQTVK